MNDLRRWHIYLQTCIILAFLSLLLTNKCAFAQTVDNFCANQYDENGDKVLTAYDRHQKYGVTGGHTFTKDESFWVYRSSFRYNFDMQCDWVDDNLIGAEAITLWMPRTTRARCHTMLSGEEKCVPYRQWTMEVFIEPQYDLGIQSDSLLNSKPRFNSLTELAEKNLSIREKLEDLFDLSDVRMYVIDPSGTRKELTIEPYEYSRDYSVYGLTRIYLTIEDETFLDTPHYKHEIEFRDGTGKVSHQIIIPATYWAQASSYQKKLPTINKKNWAGGYEIGEHLWIYTKEFAEKYSMPADNIVDEIEGADALAFRMAHYGTVNCGFFGEGESTDSCMDSTIKSLELYLPNDANLHYTNDLYQWNNNFGITPSIFMHAIKKDSRRNESFFQKRKTRLQRMLLIKRSKERTFFSLIPLAKFQKWGAESLALGSFYNASVLNNNHSFIQIKNISMWSGDETYIVFTDTQNLMKYSEQELFESNFHKVKIPYFYREKIKKYLKAYEKNNGSLWKLVEKKIK